MKPPLHDLRVEGVRDCHDAHGLVVGLVDEGENEIPAGIDVVRHDQQLTKARLTEVIGEKLRISPSQIGACRLFELRRPSNQLPQR